MEARRRAGVGRGNLTFARTVCGQSVEPGEAHGRSAPLNVGVSGLKSRVRRGVRADLPRDVGPHQGNLGRHSGTLAQKASIRRVRLPLAGSLIWYDGAMVDALTAVGVVRCPLGITAAHILGLVDAL